MWVLAYFNNDRIRFRVLYVCSDLKEILIKLKRETHVDKNRFMRFTRDGLFITDNNYFVIRTEKKPEIKTSILQQSNRNYNYKYLVEELWLIATSHARNEKIKKIL